jgi:hypothetical protein
VAERLKAPVLKTGMGASPRGFESLPLRHIDRRFPLKSVMRAWIVAGVIGTGVLGSAGAATAGWVVEQTVQGAPEASRQQILVQQNRIKTLSVGPDGRPSHAVILDLNADTITNVDYQRRQYVTATLQEYVQAMSGAAQASAGRMAESRKAMEEALKNVPPEQRKAMEQMLRQQAAQGPPGAADCAEPRREVRKTGQQATVAGYPAVRYEILADGQMESEVWMAPGLQVARELDAKKLEQFTTALAKAAPICPGRAAGPGGDPTWKLISEGFPVRTRVGGGGPGGGVAVEVVKAENRPVGAGEFQPPGGFARKTLRDMMMGQ